MKRNKQEVELFFEQIETVPNITLACEKAGLSRNTIYRWCKEDPDFKDRLTEAMSSGIESINDLAESKLITKIKYGNMRAITYWLDNNKKNYIRPRPKSVVENLLDNERIGKIIVETVDMQSVSPTDDANSSPSV